MRPWRHVVLAALPVGCLVASTMSFLDWRLNPGGLFHGPGGTSWRVVWETWVSWFVPVFFLVAAVALSVVLWRSQRH
jgi:hypothetical protein